MEVDRQDDVTDDVGDAIGQRELNDDHDSQREQVRKSPL